MAACALVAALAVTACGDDSASAPTDITPDVTFADEVTVPTGPEGDVQFDEEANGPRPEVTTDLPDGWPADFPLPDGGEILLGASAPGNGERLLSVDLLVPRSSATTVAAELEAAVRDSGFAVLVTEGGTDAEPASLIFETADYVGSVLVSEDDGGVLVVASVTAPEG